MSAENARGVPRRRSPNKAGTLKPFHIRPMHCAILTAALFTVVVRAALYDEIVAAGAPLVQLTNDFREHASRAFKPCPEGETQG